MTNFQERIPDKPSPEHKAKARSEVTRVLWFFAVGGIAILAFGPSHFASPAWWSTLDPAERTAAMCGLAVGPCLGLFAATELWRRSPCKAWQLALVSGMAVIIMMALIYVREAGIWLWSFAVADALAGSFSATFAIVALVTERRQRVRLYFSTRGFVAVPADKDA